MCTNGSAQAQNQIRAQNSLAKPPSREDVKAAKEVRLKCLVRTIPNPRDHTSMGSGTEISQCGRLEVLLVAEQLSRSQASLLFRAISMGMP